MKYEIYRKNNKCFIRTGDHNRNQPSRILDLLMCGETLTKKNCWNLTGCSKLASRISEINEALARLDAGLKVDFKNTYTRHGGYYYTYFLTAEQRDQIKDALLGVTA